MAVDSMESLWRWTLLDSMDSIGIWSSDVKWGRSIIYYYSLLLIGNILPFYCTTWILSGLIKSRKWKKLQVFITVWVSLLPLSGLHSLLPINVPSSSSSSSQSTSWPIPQCYYWISESREGHISHLPSQPLPSFLTHSFIHLSLF